MADRPERGEHAEHFDKYVTLVPDGPIAATIAGQSADALAFYRGLDEAQAAYRYAPEKWSIKQVLGHVTDTERIFTWRALAIGRGEQQALPGFDQDGYVAAANFDERSWEDLVNELVVVRAATLSLFERFTPEMLTRAGQANRGPLSVRACGFIIAGHERYHLVKLREDYLKPRPANAGA